MAVYVILGLEVPNTLPQFCPACLGLEKVERLSCLDAIEQNTFEIVKT